MGTAYLMLIPRWPWQAFAASMLLLGLGFVGLPTTLQLRGTEISPAARGKAFSLFAFNLFAGIGRRNRGARRLVDAGNYEGPVRRRGPRLDRNRHRHGALTTTAHALTIYPAAGTRGSGASMTFAQLVSNTGG